MTVRYYKATPMSDGIYAGQGCEQHLSDWTRTEYGQLAITRPQER